jgi:hypothetical protein
MVYGSGVKLKLKKAELLSLFYFCKVFSFVVWYRGTVNREEDALIKNKKNKGDLRCFETKWEYFIHFEIFSLPILIFLIIYLINYLFQLSLFDVKLITNIKV